MSVRRVAFMASLSLIILGLVASSAQSHRSPPFGGLWPHAAGTYLYMPYTITAGQPAGYYTAINGAMRAWYNTPTQVWPYPSDYNHSVVDFYIDFYDGTWLGLTINYPCYGVGCSYTQSNLYMNRNTLDSQPIFQTQKSSAHEFGHGLGLSHPCDSSPCAAQSAFSSIMFQGILPYDVPQNHDINDVNAVYP